jgi:hypothetical protein
MRALIVLSLLLLATIAVSTPAEARPPTPNPCDLGACVYVCVYGVSDHCRGIACVGYSAQIPVCLPNGT